ncbi:MAG: hypothetical protein JWM80_5634, partial [Cyanobacteria bacterium RYN_339]|nr:hypothetical protein [Cyanobacteria bacterium RYN_339]
MPKVLHVIPADATLAGFGLEAWIDAGRGFLPLVAATGTGSGELWDAYPLERVAPMRPGLAWLAAKLRREADPWTALMIERQVGLVHLHDWSVAQEVTAAAQGLDLPVVATWPAHGVPRVPAAAFDHVLA